MVDVDKLHHICEWRQPRLVVAVVATGSAVDDECDWLLDHPRAIGNEPRSVNVEPDLRSSNACLQSRALSHIPRAYSLIRGSSASRSPSPIRFAASTVIVMASPGNAMIHQALRMNWRPSLSMIP